MSVSQLPALNALLNGTATVLLCCGYVCARRGRVGAHRAFMGTATLVSAVFLCSYVLHKVLVHGVHTPFGGHGLLKLAYLVMLATHVILAMAIAYLVPRTLLLALCGELERHRRWARWTFPIWLYVSLTGVLVYLSLYQWWPAAR
jgi:uncharacterized membrane protein YozB (DUF420 family)